VIFFRPRLRLSLRSFHLLHCFPPRHFFFSHFFLLVALYAFPFVTGVSLPPPLALRLSRLPSPAPFSPAPSREDFLLSHPTASAFCFGSVTLPFSYLVLPALIQPQCAPSFFHCPMPEFLHECVIFAGSYSLPSVVSPLGVLSDLLFPVHLPLFFFLSPFPPFVSSNRPLTFARYSLPRFRTLPFSVLFPHTSVGQTDFAPSPVIRTLRRRDLFVCSSTSHFPFHLWVGQGCLTHLPATLQRFCPGGF